MRASARGRSADDTLIEPGAPPSTKKGGKHVRKQLDDESRERGPPMTKAAKAELRMVLRLCSGDKGDGGMEKTISTCLMAPEATEGAMAKLRAALLPDVFAQWHAVMRYWHMKHQSGTNGGLHPLKMEEAVKKRAVAIRRQLPSDEKAAIMRTRLVDEEARQCGVGEPEVAPEQNWVAAVGKWEAKHPNLPDRRTMASSGSAIRVWAPPRKGCRIGACDIVGRRVQKYRPDDLQQCFIIIIIIIVFCISDS